MGPYSLMDNDFTEIVRLKFEELTEQKQQGLLHNYHISIRANDGILDVYLQPVKSIKYIPLKPFITVDGAYFKELIK